MINNIGCNELARSAEFGNAKYIKAERQVPDFSFYDPAPLFRKEFVIQKNKISKAEILVQSPGFAVFYINGKRITEDLFISPISDYRKILWYNTYDVTKFLRHGKNVIGVIAGNGFLNESFKSAWPYSTATWRDSPQFLLCLKIDGIPVVVSNDSWRTSREKSHIIYNHLRSGEYVDMRKYDISWLESSYDDLEWQCAIECDTMPTGELRRCTCQPVREIEKLSPVAVTKTAEGYLLDFGVNISGYIEITLQADRGSEISFRYTEELDESGAPRYNGMDAENFYPESPFHLNKLIASGDVDTFKPMFSYHGFRYVVIEGLENEPISIFAHFTHNDVARISDFECGNEVLNYIYNAGIRSTYSNLLWILTDCPTREKLGWANDAQASVEQTLINFDILRFYEKWFEDLKSSMRDDGSLPGIIPSPDWGFKTGPICGCLLYEIPYRVWLYTGNLKMMVEAIPCFERYANYLEKKIEEGFIFALGDWMGNDNSPLIPKGFVFDFYLLKALRVTVLAHKLVNDDSCDVWERKFEEKKKEFTDKYLDDDNRCVINEQSSLAMMLASELYRDKKVISDQLVAAVIRDDYRITCGMVGIQYLYDALSSSGRTDIAYRLITESEPGYKTWYDSGATTLWECWDGKDTGSHNHHMFSGVIAWFYKSLLGISPREDFPGFERIELSPSFVASIGHVYGVMNTVKGRIEVQWEYCNGSFLYTVDIPEGLNASFRGKQLKNGKNQFIIKETANEDY